MKRSWKKCSLLHYINVLPFLFVVDHFTLLLGKITYLKNNNFHLNSPFSKFRVTDNVEETMGASLDEPEFPQPWFSLVVPRISTRVNLTTLRRVCLKLYSSPVARHAFWSASPPRWLSVGPTRSGNPSVWPTLQLIERTNNPHAPSMRAFEM